MFPILPYISRAIFLILTGAVIIKAYLIFDNNYKVSGSVSRECVCSNNYYVGDVCTPKQFNNDCKSVSGGVCSSLYCGLDEQVEPLYPKFIIALVAFTGMWMIAFIQANTKMILAHVFGNWYWNWNKSEIPSNAVPDAIVKVLK